MKGSKTGTIIDRTTIDSSGTKKKKSKIVTPITPIVNENVELTTVTNRIEANSQYIRNSLPTDVSKLNGEGGDLDTSVIALIGSSLESR